MGCHCLLLWEVLGSLICSWSTEGAGVGNVPQLLPVTSMAVHLFIYLFIYLAVPGLNCGIQDRQSSLRHLGTLVAVCGI